MRKISDRANSSSSSSSSSSSNNNNNNYYYYYGTNINGVDISQLVHRNSSNVVTASVYQNLSSVMVMQIVMTEVTNKYLVVNINIHKVTAIFLVYSTIPSLTGSELLTLYWLLASRSSVSCTFNGKYICGYYQGHYTNLQWTRIKGRGPNSVSPRTDREGTTLGE